MRSGEMAPCSGIEENLHFFQLSAVPIPCGACGGAQQNGTWPVSATCKHAAILAGCAGLTQAPVRNRTAGTQLVLHVVIRRVGIELAWALSQPERGDIEIEPSI